MIFSGMTSSNTAEYKFYLKSGVIKFQFIVIVLFITEPGFFEWKKPQINAISYKNFGCSVRLRLKS